MRRTILAVVAAVLSIPAAGPWAQAAAQGFPQKPFRIIVPFPPGGTSDILARLIGQKLTEAWGQPAIVENRGGGGGSIGMEAVKKAPPDGYTLALANQFVVTSSILNKVQFDIVKDFTGIGLVATTPLMLIANPAVKAENLKDLTELLRGNPGRMSYASCSPGSPMHFAGEQYKFLAKVSMLHVSYRGCAPAVVDAMSGQVDLAVVTAGSAIPHVRSGKLRAIAVTGRERSPAVPGVPTFRESDVAGLSDYELDSWYGVFAPADTPPEVVAALTPKMVSIMEDPEIQQKLAAAGFDKLIGDGNALMAAVKADLEKFRKLAQIAGIKTQ
jgi:tripartite-type tricarboxylate transporter receptor subunit TctC